MKAAESIANRAVWPKNHAAKNEMRKLVIQEAHTLELKLTKGAQRNPLQSHEMIPRLPAIAPGGYNTNHQNHYEHAYHKNKLGTHFLGRKREQGGIWRPTGNDKWYPNDTRWGRLPAALKSWRNLPQKPQQVEVNAVTKNNGRRIMNTTDKVKREKLRRENDGYAEDILPEEIRDIIPDEEEFGSGNLGFPVERRPATFRREMKSGKAQPATYELLKRHPGLIGTMANTEQKKERVTSLIDIWVDIYCKDVRKMPMTDLITHRIPTYRECIPKAARPRLYTPEEQKWMEDNFESLIEAGVIIQCESPWSANTKFPRKENGKLRIVNVFCSLNNVTIKSNYPMKRIEPVIKNLSRSRFTNYFKADASNGYWAVGMHLPHALKTAFSTCLGQFCYLRMGQGLTGACGTYARLKDIVTGPIPKPNPEPDLNRASERVAFSHFVDDDAGGADTFEELLEFLHKHYFPRLVWSRLTLNPAKSYFFVDEMKILGFSKTPLGIRPSADKTAAFRDWPIPRNEQELLRFLYMLPFLQTFVPGRADLSMIMKKAIIEEVQIFKVNGRKRTVKHSIGFEWGHEQQKAFEKAKQGILETVLSGGEDSVQYHLATDASNTGLGGYLFQLPTQPPDTKMDSSEKMISAMKAVMFMSYQLLPAERNYFTTEKETLAALRCLDECRWLVMGSPYPVKLYTDHSALLTTLRADAATGRLARWQLRLSEYNLDIHHIPGKDLAVADGLSRILGLPSYTVPEDQAETFLPAFAVESTTGSIGGNKPRNSQQIPQTPQIHNKTSHLGESLKYSQDEPRNTQEIHNLGGSRATSQEWRTKWSDWLQDSWYSSIVEYHNQIQPELKPGSDQYPDPEQKVTRTRAMRFSLVEGEQPMLAYRERSGELSRCLHPGEVRKALEILHNVHGHFSTDITMKRAMGIFYWPTRRKDITEFCRRI